MSTGSAAHPGRNRTGSGVRGPRLNRRAAPRLAIATVTSRLDRHPNCEKDEHDPQIRQAPEVRRPKSAKSADKSTASRKRATRQRKPSHAEIAERAYFIHLEEGGCDQLGDWLRAERELTTA